MVLCESLSKSFFDPKKGEIKAVVNASLTAKEGSITGLLGANGAGKTTLMRMLATLIKPDSGSAEVAGNQLGTNDQAIRRSIGFLSTSTALYGRLTAKEMLTYFGSLYGMSPKDIATQIVSVSRILALDEFLDQLCDKLSTGQKQRISIARAIIHDPKVLFFDEPTAGLDVVAAQTILEFIEGARDRGKTILFSTHIMSEAERLCDDIFVIDHGSIHGHGSPHDLMEETGTDRLEQAYLQLVGYKKEESA